ncbi:MAG: NRAMP family divalent metal transporter, partial [Candidatus Saccharimonadales bacterium]
MGETKTRKHYSQDQLIRLGAEAPAALLEKGILEGEKIGAPAGRLVRKGGHYWHMLGPGLTTGASDDDPSGIATYSQVGASYGYKFLWLAPWLYPLAAVTQEMCARIGLVTGRGLAANIRLHFSRRVLKWCAVLLFIANAVNIGADLGAMAKGVQLLAPHFSFAWLVVFFTLFSLGLQIFTPYVKYARYLKWLALVLIGYIFSAILAHLDWSTILAQGFIPHIPFNKTGIILVCAVLGTTISPYLFFWQTSSEVEDQITKGNTTVKLRRAATSQDEVKDMRVDVWSGMFLSEIVMFFIVAAAGGILFSHGITHIDSATQAAEALRPFAGNATYFLFAIGIIGTG